MTAWRRHRLEPAQLELDVLDGPPLYEESGQLFQADDPLVLGVLYGDGATLEQWRERFAAWPPVTFGPVTVTGASQRLEALVDAGAADGIFEGGVHARHEMPARTVVAVAFEHAGVPVLAHWSVPTERRDEFDDAERHFFGALPGGD